MANDPVLFAFSVKRLKSGRSVWTEIVAAFPHETGAGLTLVLDALPIDNRIILVEPGDEERDARADIHGAPIQSGQIIGQRLHELKRIRKFSNGQVVIEWPTHIGVTVTQYRSFIRTLIG